jgi:D-glucosaminate-6-phosphate ammonia-lyase
MTSQQGGEFYQRLGVKRVVNAASWLTVLGGSIMPPAVVKAMEDASRWFVDMNELNKKAGEVIARFTGAEAGLVTAGAAAGMMLEAAACMTGTDPAKIHRLPDTTGMKNEIVIHRAHLVNYVHSFRAAGAKLVEIGNAGHTNEWELEDAINEKTAAVAYVFSTRQAGALPLPRVVEIAHNRGVPVIVDGSAMLPPPENLTRYIGMGADMVTFSGGKGVLGPQSTGILCGRRDLIEAATLNAAPNSDSIGRAAKVCKEEIAGLVTALEIFVDTDHEAVAAGWLAKCEHVASALKGIPGIRVEVAEAHPEFDEAATTSPRTHIFFEKSWKGPSEHEVVQMLRDGDPSIRVGSAGYYGGISIVPVNLQDGEEELIARRLKEILRSRR